MKKLILIISLILVSIQGIYSQEKCSFKQEIGIILELSADLNPRSLGDVRIATGIKWRNVESTISYETFDKINFKAVDLNLFYVKQLKRKLQRFSVGFGAKAGLVNSKESLAIYLGESFYITKRLQIGLYQERRYSLLRGLVYSNQLRLAYTFL